MHSQNKTAMYLFGLQIGIVRPPLSHIHNSPPLIDHYSLYHPPSWIIVIFPANLAGGITIYVSIVGQKCTKKIDAVNPLLKVHVVSMTLM